MAWPSGSDPRSGGEGGSWPRPGQTPPSHLGVLVSSEELVEAVYPRVRLAHLRQYLEDSGCRLWVRRPQGETKRSMEAFGDLARSLAGREFTQGEICGQVFRPLRNIPSPQSEAPVQRQFCGELAVALLLGTERFRMKGLPSELLKKHPAAWTPEELDGFAGVWG